MGNSLHWENSPVGVLARISKCLDHSLRRVDQAGSLWPFGVMVDHVATEGLSVQDVQQAREAEQSSAHELQQQEFRKMFSSTSTPLWSEGSRSRKKRPSFCESLKDDHGDSSSNDAIRMDALVWNFQRCAMSPGGMLDRCVYLAEIPCMPMRMLHIGHHAQSFCPISALFKFLTCELSAFRVLLRQVSHVPANKQENVRNFLASSSYLIIPFSSYFACAMGRCELDVNYSVSAG